MRHTNYDEAKNLQDVYEIYKQTWDEHTTNRNEMLMKCAKECDSISEFGINQGSSFILLMMQNPKKIIGVDIHLNYWKRGGSYKPLEPLAKDYMKDNPMEYILHERSSHDLETVHDVDMLHIDSEHSADHLHKELEIHAHHVNKYICFHDIKQNNFELWRVIQYFIQKNRKWVLKHYYDGGTCGNVVIQKT